MSKIPITCYACFYNEDKWIAKTLDAVSCCDQIIFLDDSEDSHGRKYADKYEHCEYYKWTGKDSMSERRNFAIGWTNEKVHKPSYMDDEKIMSNMPSIKNDWILQLDADELYDKNLREELEKFIARPDVENFDTVLFPLFNMKKDNSAMGDIPIPRMFRKDTVHWRKDIQNDVECSPKMGYIPVKIRHYGYADFQTQWLKQWKRMTSLEEELQKSPDDLHRRKYVINALSIINTGNHLNFTRLFAQVSILCDQFLDNPEYHNDDDAKNLLARTMRFLWAGCMDIKNVMPYKSLLNKVWEHVNWHPDILYRSFLICKTEGLWQDMIKHGERYFDAMQKFNESVYSIEITSRGNQREVAETLHYVCTEIAKQLDGKEKKRMEKKARIWGKKKLEFISFDELTGETH
jgi:hypothetical protein